MGDIDGYWTTVEIRETARQMLHEARATFLEYESRNGEVKAMIEGIGEDPSAEDLRLVRRVAMSLGEAIVVIGLGIGSFIDPRVDAERLAEQPHQDAALSWEHVGRALGQGYDFLLATSVLLKADRVLCLEFLGGHPK